MKNIIVVSNLYPSKDRPYFGTFVKNSVRTLENNGWDVTVFVFWSNDTGHFNKRQLMSIIEVRK